jgi:serine/threonine protein kinase
MCVDNQGLTDYQTGERVNTIQP